MITKASPDRPPGGRGCPLHTRLGAQPTHCRLQGWESRAQAPRLVLLYPFLALGPSFPNLYLRPSTEIIFSTSAKDSFIREKNFCPPGISK